MQALVWHGAKDVRVEERPRPVLGGEGDAIIRVTHAAICGSDLHVYHHAMPDMRKGDILGHEFAGVVEEVGPAVRNLQPGDRVVVAAVIACGHCWFCREQLFSLCETTNPNPKMQLAYGHHIAGAYGYTHLSGGYDGGQAEYVRVPYADVGCMKLPEDIPSERGVLLSDAACTGYMAADLGQVQGQAVAVWGAGPIGLSAMAAARTLGATRVFAIDNVEHRLNVARERCGAETINFDHDPPDTTLLELTHGRGPDVCIDAVGFRYAKSTLHKVERALKLETDSADVLSEALRAVRKGGRLIIIGDYLGYTNHFLIGALMEKAISVHTGQVHTHKYWQRVLSHMQKGTYDPSFIVTHRLPLKRAAEGFKLFDQKADGVIKVVLDCTDA